MKPSTPAPDILVVDDEQQIRRLLRFTLENAGYAVREAESGHAGLVAAAHNLPAAVILDLGLPDMHGLDVLKRLREWTALPVLVLSVVGEEKTKVAALDAGADDYLTKPFGGGELLARLRVMFRRQQATGQPANVVFGPIEIDLTRRLVQRRGEMVKLTAREYELLRMLATHRDKVLTHDQLLREIWGEEAAGQTQYLRVFMMRLRQKLEDEPDNPRYLLTESGVGYRLVTEPV